MMYYMTSKVFEDIFLENEDDKDILEAQYVLVSNRIRSGGTYDNVLSAYNVLFPTTELLRYSSREDFKNAYMEYVEKNHLPFLATLVKYSVEDKYNVIFLCTKNEDKLHYLEYLSYVVYKIFKYPIYNYKDYENGKLSLIKYDKEKIVKKCNKILDNASKKGNLIKLKKFNGKDKEAALKYFRKNKKALIKILKKKGLYGKDMSTDEMLDVLESLYG